MDSEKTPVRLPRAAMFATWLVITILIFWLLIIGKGFLIPLVFAFFLLYLIEVLTSLWLRLKIAGRSMPPVLARGLAVVLMLFLVYRLADVVADNAGGVASAAPRYQERLLQVYDGALTRFDLEGPEAVQELLQRVDFGSVLGGLASGLGGLLGNGALVLVYLFFLLIERSYAKAKMRAIFRDEGFRGEITDILDRAEDTDHDHADLHERHLNRTE